MNLQRLRILIIFGRMKKLENNPDIVDYKDPKYGHRFLYGFCVWKNIKPVKRF